MRRRRHYRSNWHSDLDPPNKRRRSIYFDKFKDVNQNQPENGAQFCERNAFSKQTYKEKKINFNYKNRTINGRNNKSFDMQKKRQFTQDRSLPSENDFLGDFETNKFQSRTRSKVDLNNAMSSDTVDRDVILQTDSFNNNRSYSRFNKAYEPTVNYTNRSRYVGEDLQLSWQQDTCTIPRLQTEPQNSSRNIINSWQPVVEQRSKIQPFDTRHPQTVTCTNSHSSNSINQRWSNESESVRNFIKIDPDTVQDDVEKRSVKSHRSKTIKKRKRVPETVSDPIVPRPINEKLIIRNSVSSEPEITFPDDLDTLNSTVLECTQEETVNVRITTSTNSTQTEAEPEKRNRRSRNNKDFCEICDKKGHSAMQCQMICINCNEPYHNMKSCKQPSHTKKTLINFLDFCVQQFATDEINVQNTK